MVVSEVNNIFYIYHYQKNTITREHVQVNELTEIINSYGFPQHN